MKEIKLFFLVLLERTHEGSLVLGGLEPSVAKLGGSVDELETDLLQCLPLGLDQEGLPKSEDSLLRPNAASLDHDEVLFDLAVVGEAAHGVDALVSQIVLGAGVVLDQLAVLHLESLAHSVDLLVDLGTVMVSLLTSPGHSELDSAGMPGSDTGDLSQTFVSLAGKLLGVPTAGDALESVTLGDTDNVEHLVLFKDLSDWHLLLKVFPSPVDLVGNAPSVQLDLHNVSLLLPPPQKLHLCVDDNSYGGAILFDLVKVLLNLLLAEVVGPLGAALGESLLLGLRPILVEPPLALLADMLSPDSLESAHTTRGLDITNNTHSDHGRSFNNSHSFNNFLLVILGTRTVHLTYDMGHTSLVSHEACKMDRLARVILWESLSFTSMPL